MNIVGFILYPDHIINITLDAQKNKGVYYETVTENCLSIILAHIFENMVEYDTTTFDTVEVYFEDGQLQKIWFTEADKTLVVSVAYGEAEFTNPDAE